MTGNVGIPSLFLHLSHAYGDKAVARASPLLDVFAWSPYSLLSRSDAADSLHVETSFNEVDVGIFRLEHRLRAGRGLFLTRCMALLELTDLPGEDGFRFVPHLHPEPDMVAPDQVFRSPCEILRNGNPRPLPWCQTSRPWKL